MALRRLFSKRLFNGTRGATSPPVTVDHPPVTLSSRSAKFDRKYLMSPESAWKGFFRRFLHRRAIDQLPEFLAIPVGDRLRETLLSLNSNNAVSRPSQPPVKAPVAGERRGLDVEDVRKLLRVAQVERLKVRVKAMPESVIPYNEFVKFCVDECGGNENQGLECSRLLDQAGNVVVLGDVVLLRPDQVAKSMESIISRNLTTPNDPRRKQLEVLEEQKALIDRKARALVRGELYCGLGFLVVQTLGFMRLTFWELSWDVMEPICFFVTSLHFALAYGFFLRTSTEPSFEGYFRRRFKSKQENLMKLHNFDHEKYKELRKLFHPNVDHDIQLHKPHDREKGEFVSV